MTRWVCRHCGDGIDTHALQTDEVGAVLVCITCGCTLRLPVRLEVEWTPPINSERPEPA